MRLRGQDGVSSSGVRSYVQSPGSEKCLEEEVRWVSRTQNSVSVYIGTLGLGDVLRGEDVFCEDVATEGGGYLDARQIA